MGLVGRAGMANDAPVAICGEEPCRLLVIIPECRFALWQGPEGFGNQSNGPCLVEIADEADLYRAIGQPV